MEMLDNNTRGEDGTDGELVSGEEQRQVSGETWTVKVICKDR